MMATIASGLCRTLLGFVASAKEALVAMKVTIAAIVICLVFILLILLLLMVLFFKGPKKFSSFCMFLVNHGKITEGVREDYGFVILKPWMCIELKNIFKSLKNNILRLLKPCRIFLVEIGNSYHFNSAKRFWW